MHEPLNRDHHLCQTKHGGFTMSCTIAPTPATSRPVKLGLGTRSRTVARSRRDAVLLWLALRGVLIGLRLARHSTLSLTADDQQWLESICLHEFSDVFHHLVRQPLEPSGSKSRP